MLTYIRNNQCKSPLKDSNISLESVKSSGKFKYKQANKMNKHQAKQAYIKHALKKRAYTNMKTKKYAQIVICCDEWDSTRAPLDICTDFFWSVESIERLWKEWICGVCFRLRCGDWCWWVDFVRVFAFEYKENMFWILIKYNQCVRDWEMN